MNTRQIFEKVRDHLLEQKEKAYDESKDMCLYRAPNGNKCAIGALIKDEYYDLGFEGLGIFQLADDYKSPNVYIEKFRQALCKSLGVDFLSEEVRLMLNDLQIIHDEDEPTYWQEALNRYEVNYF
jgi:hypothetical protein